MNRTEFVNQTFFYKFHFLQFCVERFLMIGSPSGKKLKVHMRSKVRGFDSNDGVIQLT